MQRAIPHRSPSLLPRLLLPAALLLAACDRGDEPETPEPADDRAAEAASSAVDGPSHARAHRRGKGKKVDRLCETLACTDEQRARIDGLAERLWSKRSEREGDREAARQALAEAFAGDGFSAADIQAFGRAGPATDGPDARLAEAVVELHGILDREQRAVLADKVQRRGLPFMGARGSKHERTKGDGERGAKLAERLCQRVSCTETQATEIAALTAGLPEPGQVPSADREALANALRGSSLSEHDVHAYLDAAAKVRAADLAALEAKVVELHGLLTPAQRATVAERLAEDGPSGVFGKGHHGKRGPGEKKQRRGGPQGQAAQFG
jgi:Spy/CpxP family protein refolding chaperone